MTRMSEERLSEIQSRARVYKGEPEYDNSEDDVEHLLAEVDALRAELSQTQELVAAFQAASMLEIGGDPDGITPAHVEREVTSLRAELSAFRRAVLTDGAGGTEEEVTPEALEAELRLLRARPGQCEDVLEVAGDKIQCERIRGHESGHSGEAFDWSDP